MTFSSIIWPMDSQQAAELSIRLFALQRGWRAFNSEEWVVYLLARYPVIQSTALSCSSLQPEALQEQIRVVINIATSAGEDQALIVAFFAAKLGLEELSCRLNGAGARLCDKRLAYWAILQSLLTHLQ